MSNKFTPKPGRPANAKTAADIQAEREKAAAEFQKQLALRANRAPPPPPEPEPAKNPNPTEEATPLDPEGAVLDSSWEQVDLPSAFIFYDWSNISVRRFEPMDQAKLARAVRHKNVSLVLDVLASCCNRDSRELSIGDFRALCLWHRRNSYANTTVKVQWLSKYGNQLDVTVKSTNIKETKPTKTRADYLADKEKGFAVPTARDLETIEVNDIDEDTMYLFDKAQFIDLAPLGESVELLKQKGSRIPTVMARIERMQEMAKGTKFQLFEDIDAFAESYQNFGMQEIATILDTKFEPKAAIDFLQQTDTPAALEEVRRIQNAILAGETPKAEAEDVPLQFNVWSMFPYI